MKIVLFGEIMYKIAVFDLDGTLINTLPDLLPAFNKAVEAYGYAPCPPDRFGKVIGNGYQTSLRRILPADFDNEEIFEDICRIYHDYYSQHYADRTYPYDGICDVLQTLQDNGVLIAVLSNKTREHSAILCKKLFPSIEFCDICGADAGYLLKPDPAQLKKIIDDHHCSINEAIMIGDSNVDVYTAHNAGIPCVGCEWGYRGRQELLEASADFLIKHPLELLELIKE